AHGHLFRKCLGSLFTERIGDMLRQPGAQFGAKRLILHSLLVLGSGRHALLPPKNRSWPRLIRDPHNTTPLVAGPCPGDTSSLAGTRTIFKSKLGKSSATARAPRLIGVAQRRQSTRDCATTTMASYCRQTAGEGSRCH